MLTNLDKAKKAEILKTLKKHNWNVSKSCKELGISRATYYRNIKKFELERTNEL